MSSINLLPKKIRYKEDEERRKKIIFAFSVLLLVISAVSYLGVYANKIIASNRSKELSVEMEKVSMDIEKEIKNNELFLTKNQIKDIAEMLGNHSYFSKAFNIIQNIIVDDVCLEESSLLLNEDEVLVMEISGVANNYSTVINQIAIFKNSYWIDEVEINDVSLEEEGGAVFSGNLKFRKEAILFHEDYWHFGLSLLSLKADRYLKINEYSAELKKAVDSDEEFIEVKFGGIVYDAEKIVSLESDLKEMSSFVKSVSVLYDLNKKNDDNTIDFSGKMELNMPSN